MPAALQIFEGSLQLGPRDGRLGVGAVDGLEHFVGNETLRNRDP